ncbi:MAG: CGNR zinc finger domain-containing protein [Longimicrobiales bacterium]
MPTSLCLEFTQTRGWAPRDRSDDALATYSDLVAWARARALVPEREARRLRAWATSHPRKAARTLESARALRAVIYRIFAAVGAGGAAADADVRLLNRWLGPARAHQGLERSGDGWAYGWSGGPGPEPERPLWPIVVSAAGLLTGEGLERVRLCAADDCGWLFLDDSRNRSRRWCDMSDCGNRAKARRYRARHRAED